MTATSRHTRTGRIVLSDESATSCTIRAISRVGATIQLAPGEALSPHFTLIDGRDAFEARRVWRKGDLVGVMLRRAVAA